jgi:hypothetical protein
MSTPRTFNVTATVAGARMSPPDATMTALGLATYTNGGRLWAGAKLIVRNFGENTVFIRTDEDGDPANAGEATVTHLILLPAQGDVILPPGEPGSANDTIAPHQFYAFAEADTSDISVEVV